MILPISIPAWIKVQKRAALRQVKLSFNVNPITGKHGGHFFKEGKTHAFQMQMFSKNMLLSLKTYDQELMLDIESMFDATPFLIYQTNDPSNEGFDIHLEWYFNSTVEEVEAEMDRFIDASGNDYVVLFKRTNLTEEGLTPNL